LILLAKIDCLPDHFAGHRLLFTARACSPNSSVCHPNVLAPGHCLPRFHAGLRLTVCL